MSSSSCYNEEMEKLVTLSIAGYDLETVLQETTDTKKLIILVHGLAASRDEVGDLFKKLANTLSENGISSVRYNQIGCGTSELSSKEATLSKARKEVLAIYDYYKGLGYEHIGILGFSLGARIMAGVLHKRQFDYAVSWAGAISNGLGPFSYYYDRFYDIALRDGYADIKLSWRGPFYLSKEWFDEISDDRALDMIKAYEGPLLVVAGTLDTLVTHDYADAIIATTTHKQSQLISLPTNHTFGVLEDIDYSDQVIAMTVNYIRKLTP